MPAKAIVQVGGKYVVSGVMLESFRKANRALPESRTVYQRGLFANRGQEQCLFLCYGDGANGKSTLLETVRSLLGDYAPSGRELDVGDCLCCFKIGGGHSRRTSCRRAMDRQDRDVVFLSESARGLGNICCGGT